MNILRALSVTIVLVLSTGANADLAGRLAATPGGTDYQAYYNDEANLTWLADANAGGAMDWWQAMSWVAGLNVGGVTGWRLPETLQPDASCSNQDANGSFGYYCSGSEMGNLFYNVLSNTAGGATDNVGPFSNYQFGGYYSATENTIGSYDYVWSFNMDSGGQGFGYKIYSNSAWAVKTSDVSAVPVPAAVWLFGSGLLGLIAVARRKKV